MIFIRKVSNYSGSCSRTIPIDIREERPMHHRSADLRDIQPQTKSLQRSRRRHILVALAGVLILASASMADARSKGSMGSRGSRTQDAPAATQTAPTTAQPLQRTQTTPSQAQPSPVSPGTQAAQPARSRFGGGFFAGLLGAGLLGALFGAGLFGGLGSLASILGFVLQVALIGGLIFLAVRFFRRRQQPTLAGAGAGGPMQRSALGGGAPLKGGAAFSGGVGSAGLGASAAPSGPAVQEITLNDDDFAGFEVALEKVQTAFGREDVAALWELATPEMAGYYQEELNENARKGLRGTIADVKLLQGDLSEAWREGTTDYATVAMRYAITEQVTERASGKAVSSGSEEVTEVWTFRRDQGGSWKVSAVQQVQ
jgi:predicted lipid-binding transport protein (Tim44 family)